MGRIWAEGGYTRADFGRLTGHLRDSGVSDDVGVALFADYSATAQDWRSYQSGWVRPPV
jgi:hypothetical protein